MTVRKGMRIMDQNIHDAQMADKITEADRLKQERDFLFMVSLSPQPPVVRGMIRHALYGGDRPNCSFQPEELENCRRVSEMAPAHLKWAMNDSISHLRSLSEETKDVVMTINYGERLKA